MRCERIQPGESASATAASLRALIPSAESVAEAVWEIIAGVDARGDQAVLDYTRLLDTHGAEPPPLRVDSGELVRAADALDQAVGAGLEQAIENVREVATASLDAESD